jgi:hypothetical protein
MISRDVPAEYRSRKAISCPSRKADRVEIIECAKVLEIATVEIPFGQQHRGRQVHRRSIKLESKESQVREITFRNHFREYAASTGEILARI